MTEALITIGLVVVVAFFSERWEQRRGFDEELAARQGDYGWRLIKLLGLTIFVLAVGLALAGVGIPGARIAALVALAALLLLIYVAPFLGPRRRRR